VRGVCAGEFYRQFALTIAISTVISAFNSLTLSPALAALLLKERDAPKDALSRGIDTTFGWLFRPFNRFFVRSANSYVSAGLRVSELKAEITVEIAMVSANWR
jgi:multidrug efflux pump